MTQFGKEILQKVSPAMWRQIQLKHFCCTGMTSIPGLNCYQQSRLGLLHCSLVYFISAEDPASTAWRTSLTAMVAFPNQLIYFLFVMCLTGSVDSFECSCTMFSKFWGSKARNPTSSSGIDIMKHKAVVQLIMCIQRESSFGTIYKSILYKKSLLRHLLLYKYGKKKDVTAFNVKAKNAIYQIESGWLSKYT